MTCTYCDKPFGTTPVRDGMHTGCAIRAAFDCIYKDDEILGYGVVGGIEVGNGKRVGTYDNMAVWQPNSVSSSRAWEVC